MAEHRIGQYGTGWYWYAVTNGEEFGMAGFASEADATASFDEWSAKSVG